MCTERAKPRGTNHDNNNTANCEARKGMILQRNVLGWNTDEFTLSMANKLFHKFHRELYLKLFT